MKMLCAVGQASTVLEVGMFTGTSALAMAEIIPDNGKVRSPHIQGVLFRMHPPPAPPPAIANAPYLVAPAAPHCHQPSPRVVSTC